MKKKVLYSKAQIDRNEFKSIQNIRGLLAKRNIRSNSKGDQQCKTEISTSSKFFDDWYGTSDSKLIYWWKNEKFPYNC